MLKESLRSILQPMAQEEDKATAKANVNLNVIIQAGVNILGSKNVVVFNGKRGPSKDDTKVDVPLTERKRKAESVSCHHAHGCWPKQTLMSRIGFRRLSDDADQEGQGRRMMWGMAPCYDSRISNRVEPSSSQSCRCVSRMACGTNPQDFHFDSFDEGFLLCKTFS